MATADSSALVRLAWQRLVTTSKFGSDAHRPGEISGHSFSLIGTNAYVFGGVCCDAEGIAQASGNLFILRMASMEWSKIEISKSQTCPPARWRHSACTINGSQILIMGGFHSNDQRLNDVWIYDVANGLWQQPHVEHNVEAATPHLLSNTTWANVMSPRGSHSATVIGKSVYIFGGYGGSGYSRRDLDDLLCLNYETWTWTKTAARGTPPEKRCGHTACAIENKLYIIGGWSSGTQFQDIHILDVDGDQLSWSSPSITLGSPTWNLSCAAVMAIPTWKVFVFGGVSGILSDVERKGRMVDTLAVLESSDTSSQLQRLSLPELEGDKPCARSEASVVYDEKNTRLILFGGWSDKWHDDLFFLDVGEVVGPPYAISDIKPNMGPITGNTLISVFGVDFFQSKDIVVRFGNRKYFLDVPGTFVNQTKLTCLTPDFTKFPPGMVEVRVAINGGSLSTTSCRYTFFPVTNGSKSIAFGPGLMAGCCFGEEASFAIQSRDENGVDRATGGDEFDVEVVHRDSSGAETNCISSVEFDDFQNGKYIVRYRVERPGKFIVRVVFKGSFGGSAGPLIGSGTTAEFVVSASPQNNAMTGPLALRCLSEDIASLNSVSKETGDAIFVRLKDESWTLDEQIRVLVTVKGRLQVVDKKAPEMSLLIARSEALLRFIRTAGINVDLLSANLSEGTAAWEKIVREAPQIQNRIVPLMRAQLPKIRADILANEGRLQAYLKGLGSALFRTFTTGVGKAIDLLDKADAVCVKERQNISRLVHIAAIFDCERDTLNSKNILTETEELLRDFRQLWVCIAKAQNVIESAKNILWSALDPEEFEDNAKLQVQTAKKLPKSVKQSDAFKGLDRITKDFLCTCPLISALRSPAMRDRHWQELMTIVKKQFPVPTMSSNVTIKQLLELELHKVANDVEELTDKASKEARHEGVLNGLQVTWTEVQFVMSYYKETDVPLLKMEDVHVEQLESDQLAVQSIVGGRYPFFKAKAVEWQGALASISDVTQVLSEIQRTWCYLEPLFIGSEEVKKELPADAAKFKEIDREVKSILKAAWVTRNVKQACMQVGLLGKLEELQVKQEQCKKALGEFLDGKRRQFARFYFMSETDLLDLLSNSSQPVKVLQHVDKILLATKHIEIDKNRNLVDDGRLYAFHFDSQVGHETVKFNPICRIGGKAEMYLQALLEAQQRTLSKCLTACIARSASIPRTEWLLKRENGDSVDPAQIILLVALIDFTAKTEQTISNVGKGDLNAMKESLRVVSTQLADLIRLTQTSLSSGDRQRLMCLITLDAHNRDIVESLILEKVTNISDFQWQSKLRPSIVPPQDSKSDESAAKFYICNASFEYGFEYLGNGPRLVVTPLTDRIYVTATQALHLKMGCAPAGPAGTGKTESTKELASALGKCCYVFNCSPEMDYQSMGNIFKGLAASGSWGCFDEFNRLIPEVLSVCSVQFKAVCDALKAYDPRIESTHQVTIEGDTVALDPTCGAFITMNPGYLGRSELPEGLKALFRPITVVVPDLVLICENMLMAEGFLTAKILASKFYGLYSLLSELLSKQPHYDWGLRAVKSVLVVAGMLKRAEPDLAEDALLMRALRDFNIPKIVQADEVVFFGLLNDLFPGLSPERVVDEKLESCVINACETAKLLPDPFFCLKVMQMEELLAIRHCVFIMGPSGAGKSTCWKMLQAARNLKTPNNKVKVVDLNPKVMPTEYLYGHINMVTREWKDGLLSAVLRDLGRIPNEQPKWLVLDGDLDANWIESMNSVMDDNKMLTLASNERIPLKHYMRMIFEIRDLKYATPATVSRAGILFISTDEGTQWRSITSNWVRTRPKDLLDDTEKDRLQALFDRFLPECIRFSRVTLRQVVTCNDVSIVTSLLRMLDAMINRSVLAEEVFLESAFVFCLIWAFGSVLTISDDGTDNKKIFSEWFRGKFKLKTIPSRDSIFDYWLDNKSYKFEPWKSSPAFKVVEFDSSRMSMAQVTIPTAETSSVSFWLELLVHRGNHAMLAGPAGTGKTQLINGLIAGLNKDQYMSLTVNMNYFTSASVLLTSLELPLQKRTGSVFGPPGSFKLVYFVDDLNLPELDSYGTQSAIALLRQHIDYGHWYDMSKLSLKAVDDCMYIAALNPTAGSFNVNARLQRHFTTFAIGMPSSASLLTIFQTFLEGHLVGSGFSHDICSCATNIVKASLNVHRDVSETFRKTAANFHYEFNIRHLANVFQGLLVANTQVIRDAEKLVLLWLHESERAYGDRLVSAEDLLKFKEIIQNQARKTFIQYNVSRFAPSNGNTKSELLLFCHFADGINQGGELTYDRATNIDDVRSVLESALDEYNESHSMMSLVLFDDAVLHVARIVRIIKQSGGHALLVGVGGSGKQSLSRIAGHICGYNTVQISASQQYTLNDLKADLQNMYSKSGIKQEGVLFILSDAQINNERFFVYLNDLLSSGNIPDLYSRDEKEGIVNALTGKAKSAGYSPEPASVWSYFISRIRDNLHCCLCFSPVGPLLRTRAKRFPALANCTVIDWFQPWPEQALLSVGKRLLTNVDLGSEEVHAAVVKYAPAAFLGVTEACQLFASKENRMVYTTPKSYLEAIHLFQAILAKKRQETDSSIHRLATGVEKLIRAAADVVELESKLKVMLATAEEKRRVTEDIAKNLKLEKDVVEAENDKALVESANVSRIQIEVAAKQADAQSDLAQAEPALVRAMAALDSLDRRDLGNCKTMAKPPPGVEDVFGAVMVLLAGINPNIIVQKTGKVREKERTWDASKKALLGNVNSFLDELKAFKTNIDEGSVPEMNWKEIRPFLTLEHFTPEIIEKRNSAAAGLCGWVINIVNYFDIVQLVEPKRIALREANEQLRVANEQLDVVRAKVAELQEKLDILTADFNAAEESMKEAQNTANKGKMKLELANRLTNALGSERQRWLDGIEGFKAERDVLVGDCLLASVFISYVGPFTKPFRDYLMGTYMNPLLSKSGASIPCTTGADALAIVCSDAEVAAYQTQGLPADKVSSENAAIVLNSVRYPLLVDPQLQAVFWLKRRAKLTGQNMRVGRLGQNGLIKDIMSAIENGETFLVENIGEQIDASLMSILRRTTVKRGGKSFIVLGDSEVEFNSSFRLYLHTKLSNPHYPPEIQAETTLVNFSVTPGGLEEQILALVVKNERPDLAAQRAALILQQNLFLIRVKQLEDNILVRLSDAQGDITEDRALIEELEMSKKISDEIAHKLTESQKTSEKIDMTSELYRPVAKRGSLLFFIMNNLNRIHTYYMFSLNSFLYFFLHGITRAGKVEGAESDEVHSDILHEDSNNESVDLDVLAAAIERRVQEIEERDKLAISENLPERINLLKKSASNVIFDFIRTGLFEQDKLTVASQISLRILAEEGGLDKTLVDAICRCRTADDVPPRGDDLSKWLSENSWSRLKALEEDLSASYPLFGDILEKFTAECEDWEEWYNQPNPENMPMPGEWKELQQFQKILLLRILRPDRFPTAMSHYISEHLGPEFVTQPSFDLDKTYKYTTSATPILFVLYPGVDPTTWVEDLGRKYGMTAESRLFANISMGQGQEARADNIIKEFAKVGGWVLLQNVHLMQTWITTLEEKLETLSPHHKFRVFITAEPPPLPYMKNIPEGLLQSSIVVANEPPSDLRANLARAWGLFDEERLCQCIKYTEFRACLFGLCFFHSLILGRRRFGFQGWSRSYGFNNGDLRICSDVLESNLNRDIPTVPWKDLIYMFGEIMYGGHITDYFDRRTNNAYLEFIFKDSLLNEGELSIGFRAPSANMLDYQGYLNFISTKLPDENPSMYGLHANAEIGFLSNKTEKLFQSIIALDMGSTAGTETSDGSSPLALARDTIDTLLKTLPHQFILLELSEKIKNDVPESDLPYAVVVMQECTRINSLIQEIRVSLEELVMGMNGQLNMSQSMEDMLECMTINLVPGRNPFHACSWERLAWPSRKTLSSWFADMTLRRAQLDGWSKTMQLPYSVWLPGLINPTTLLTAIKQVTARKHKLPLDRMTLDTHVTRTYRYAETLALGLYPEDGIFVHGLLLEGARWTDEEESTDDVYNLGGTTCAGHLTESRLKQLLSPMPVVYVRAIPVQPNWLPTSVGYLRGDNTQYECPVYLTSARGGTFVFLATLRSTEAAFRWVLAGVVILLQSDD